MKVLIATGGTGGHIFPALKLARLLRDHGHEVMFAGVLGIAEDQILSAGFDLINIKAKGFNPRSLIGMIKFVWLMTGAIIRSVGIIHQVRPDKVIGFGGYGSFPIIMAGWFCRCRMMIHEQNVYPGKANRLMGRFVQQVAVSFRDSARFFDAAKIIHTGCPCHVTSQLPNQQDARAKFDLDRFKWTVLILGGSQGSHKINEVFYEWMKVQGKERTCQAIHMTGKQDYAKFHQLYIDQHLPVNACAFISNMIDAYAAADVVIARAGASSITEIGLLGRPAVIVPYPFAGGHQRYNAKVLADLGTAIVIEQDEFTTATLDEALRKIVNRHQTTAMLQEQVDGVLFMDADQRLAKALESL